MFSIVLDVIYGLLFGIIITAAKNSSPDAQAYKRKLDSFTLFHVVNFIEHMPKGVAVIG